MMRSKVATLALRCLSRRACSASNLLLAPARTVALRSSSLRCVLLRTPLYACSNSASRSAASSSVSASCGGWHRRDGVGGCFGCGLRVMHRAMLVRANGQLAAKLLAVDDDGGFGGFARHHWFRVRVVDHGLESPERGRAARLPVAVLWDCASRSRSGRGRDGLQSPGQGMPQPCCGSSLSRGTGRTARRKRGTCCIRCGGGR